MCRILPREVHFGLDFRVYRVQPSGECTFMNIHIFIHIHSRCSVGWGVYSKQANAERDDEESVARMAARARAGHEMVEARAAEARQVRAATVARELRLTSRGARAKQTKTQAVVIHGGTAVAAAGVSRARKHSLRTTELAPTHLSRNELYQTPPPR